jgi:phosphoserine phosphatase
MKRLLMKSLVLLLLLTTQVILAQDPLPSWNDGPSKKAIIEFVKTTTEKGTANFVPVADRIACFDNDGTLWEEQPVPAQFYFAIDRIKKLAPQHPEWKTTQPFQAVLEGDMKTVMSGGGKALLQIIAATDAGMTTDEYEKIVEDWLSAARHPKTGKPFNEMTYQPMVELLKYLRANDYKTFIVSGGSTDFMRVFSEEAYGIPPYQVIGSTIKIEYDTANGQSVLMKLPEMTYFDDKAGKPVSIHQYIGKQPVFAAGNSDGDYDMLKYTCTGKGPHFGMFVHHTDGARDYAYGDEPGLAQLKKGLQDAAKFNWLVVDVKTDWKRIFAFEK